MIISLPTFWVCYASYSVVIHPNLTEAVFWVSGKPCVL